MPASIAPVAEGRTADADSSAQAPEHPAVIRRPDRSRSRLTTGSIIFLVLAFALAPVGAIAVGAGVRTIAASDRQREGLLRVSASDKANLLDRIFVANALRLNHGLTQIASRPAALANAPSMPADIAGQPPAPLSAAPAVTVLAAPPPPACAEAERLFPGSGAASVAVQIVDRRTGADLCVAGVPADRSAIGRPLGSARIDRAQQRIVHSVAAVGAHGVAELIYPIARIDSLLQVDSALPPHRLSLVSADERIDLRDTLNDNVGLLTMSSRAGLGRTGLALEYSASRSWFDGPEIVAMVTPVGMWLLAALLSWLVVDRILLNPIQRLRRSMAIYQPGDRLERGRTSPLAAAEVVTLEDMLQQLADDVATDKQALAAGLDAQRALTREVHHRVKNNIQIIASLISLHSRDARSADAAAAYHSIQRRVEALAVVHRHLHAETESGHGIALGTMLGELTVGLRHGLTADDGQVTLTLDAVSAQVVQDVALPAAFFVTELVELATSCDPGQPVAIRLDRTGDGFARLSVTAPALIGCRDDAADRFANYERVLTGLARQLRNPLEQDDAIGRYSIAVPIIR